MELRAKYQIQDIEKLIKEDLERQGFTLTGMDNSNTATGGRPENFELWYQIAIAPALAKATSSAVVEEPIRQAATTTEAKPKKKAAAGPYPPERVQNMLDGKKRKAEERRLAAEALAAQQSPQETVPLVEPVAPQVIEQDPLLKKIAEVEAKANGNGNGHHEEPIAEMVEVVAATGPSFPG